MPQDTSSSIEKLSPKAPFESVSFLFNDRAHGRIVVRITKNDPDTPAPSPFDGEFDFLEAGVAPSEMVDEPNDHPLTYTMQYEIGPADHAQSDTVTLSLDQAVALQQAFVDAGVFTWDATYGDDPSVPAAKWSLNIVLQEGVFTQSARGGSNYPAGFDRMMQAFYAVGLPNAERRQPQQTPPAMGGFDPSSMFGAMQDMLQSGVPQQALDEMREVMDELRDHPEAFQERLRSEFRSLSPERQNELLNMLSSSGVVSREWWENFFRG